MAGHLQIGRNALLLFRAHPKLGVGWPSVFSLMARAAIVGAHSIFVATITELLPTIAEVIKLDCARYQTELNRISGYCTVGLLQTSIILFLAVS